MKTISYILFLVAFGLAVLGLVLFFKNENDKRGEVDPLEKARRTKVVKKRAEDKARVKELKELNEEYRELTEDLKLKDDGEQTSSIEKE